jgi:hypothetical protein
VIVEEVRQHRLGDLVGIGLAEADAEDDRPVQIGETAIVAAAWWPRLPSRRRGVWPIYQCLTGQRRASRRPLSVFGGV